MRLSISRAAGAVAIAALVGPVALAGCSAENRTVAHASTLTDPLSLVQPVIPGLLGSGETESIAAQQRCTAVKRSFRPTVAKARGVAKHATVLALHRNADGSLAVPPLTAEGKQDFAFDKDQGIRPGDRHGHVLFNAHTYPDGSALGNRLLAHLHVGDKIVVSGRRAWQRLCYRVVDRVKVTRARYPRYYRRTGPPRLAIVVCSGRRLGPGQWESHTVWFAAPLPRRN